MPAYPVGGQTTSLGQFIQRATTSYSCKLETPNIEITGPDGEKFHPRYLVTKNDRIVALPALDDDVLLSIEIIKNLCIRLGIPETEFILNDPHKYQ